MARGSKASGPLGNSPRDVRDDFIGIPADPIKTGKPPRWPPNPKKVKTNTFHAKVSGGSSAKRADRPAHYRRGGWVSGYATGGEVARSKKQDALPTKEKNDPLSPMNLKRKAGGVAKRQFGGDAEDEPGQAQSAAEAAAARTRRSVISPARSSLPSTAEEPASSFNERFGAVPGSKVDVPLPRSRPTPTQPAPVVKSRPVVKPSPGDRPARAAALPSFKRESILAGPGSSSFGGGGYKGGGKVKK